MSTNPAALARQLRAAGYAVSRASVEACLQDGPAVAGRHRLLIREQSTEAGRSLVAIATHCEPPVLVADEDQVYLRRADVPDPPPSVRVRISVPGHVHRLLVESYGDRLNHALTYLLEDHANTLHHGER